MRNIARLRMLVYDIKYHFVWITKYSKPVLLGDVATRLRDLIREICKSMDIEMIRGHVSKDHVHPVRVCAAVSSGQHGDEAR